MRPATMQMRVPFALHGEQGTIVLDSRDPVATGGTADVLSGTLVINNRTELVALKCCRREVNDVRLTVFKREAKTWPKLKHPRLLPFYGSCELERYSMVLVSPYMTNGTLSQFLKANPGVNRFPLLLQIAEGLYYLHKDVHRVHGDLNGSNVLISPQGTALLADFGLSTTSYPNAEVTQTNVRNLYTLRFTAPEVMEGEAHDPLHPQITRSKTTMSDIYAFGMLIYQVLTGVPPWDGLSQIQVILSIKSGPAPQRPAVDLLGNTPLSEYLWDMHALCSVNTPTLRPTIDEVLRNLEKMSSSRSQLWDSFLPAEIRGTLPKDVHDTVLAWYFKHNLLVALLVVPHLFVHDMSLYGQSSAIAPERTTFYSPALHCAVLANASSLSQAGSILTRLEVQMKLVEHAQRLLAHEERNPTMVFTSLQTHALLAQFRVAQGEYLDVFTETYRYARRWNFPDLPLIHADDVNGRMAIQLLHCALFIQETWWQTPLISDMSGSRDYDTSLGLPEPEYDVDAMAAWLEGTTPPRFRRRNTYPRWETARRVSVMDTPAPPAAVTLVHLCNLMKIARRAFSAEVPAERVRVLDDIYAWQARLPLVLNDWPGSIADAPSHVLMLHLFREWLVLNIKSNAHELNDYEPFLTLLREIRRIGGLDIAPPMLIYAIKGLVHRAEQCLGRQDLIPVFRAAQKALFAMGTTWPTARDAAAGPQIALELMVDPVGDLKKFEPAKKRARPMSQTAETLSAFLRNSMYVAAPI